MGPSTDVLIIGAGPFGLALAAYKQHNLTARRQGDGLLEEPDAGGDVIALGQRLAPRSRGPPDNRGPTWSSRGCAGRCRAAILVTSTWATRAGSPEQAACTQRNPSGSSAWTKLRTAPWSPLRKRRPHQRAPGSAGARDGLLPDVPPEYVALLPPGRYAHTCELVDSRSGPANAA